MGGNRDFDLENVMFRELQRERGDNVLPRCELIGGMQE